MTVTSTEQSTRAESAEPLELLIKEARAATRRRRLGRFAILVVAALVASLIVAVVGTSKPKAPVGSGDKHPKVSAFITSPCTSSQLRVTSDRGGWHANEAAAGQFTETLSFTNVANRTCQFKGWPRVIAVVNGVSETTTMTKVFQNKRPSLVRLAPRRTASFDIYGGDWDPIHNKACPQSTNGLLVSPPGDSKSVYVEVEEPMCGGFLVAPVIAGSSDRQSWSNTVQ